MLTDTPRPPAAHAGPIRQTTNEPGSRREQAMTHRWRNLIVTMLAVLAGLVLQAGVGPNAGAASTGPAITPTQILQRAQQWINEAVPYSQTAFHTDSLGTYRQDCSGFVSMAWDLPTSLTTNTLPSVATQLSGFGALQPGDMIDTVANGHVVLFVGWADSAKTTATIDEEPKAGQNAKQTTMTVAYMQQYKYAPYRYRNLAAVPLVVGKTIAAGNHGYYVLSSDGGVIPFGGAPFYGAAAGQSYFAGKQAVALGIAPNGSGYWILSSDGGIYSYGAAPFYGAGAGQSYFAGKQAVALGVAPTGSGYWILSSDGGIYSYGAAGFYGAATGQSYFAGKQAVALGVAPTGYWILSADGGIYSYGAPFYGAAAGQSYFAGKQAVALGVGPNGVGYWILSADGGVYSYGASFYGAPTGQSYFAGRTAAAMGTTPAGYWILSADGGVYTYGDAPFYGSGV